MISGAREATGLFLQPDRCPLEGVPLPSPGSPVPTGALKCKRGDVMLGRGRLTAGVRTRCGVCGHSLDGFAKPFPASFSQITAARVTVTGVVVIKTSKNGDCCFV